MTSRAGRLAAGLAKSVGVLSVWRFLRARRMRLADIVTYHRVSDGRRSSDGSAFLEGIGVSLFDEQIAFLARTYEIVPLELFVRCIRERTPWPRRALAVTIDDGYRDAHEHAFPIFKKYRIPATIFLTAGCIENQQMLWWDRIHRGVLRCRRWPEPSELPSSIYPAPLRQAWSGWNASNFDGRRRISGELVSWLKKAPDEVRLAALNDLAARLGEPADVDRDDDALLSWAEIREMADSSISFGAHTLSHPSLDGLDIKCLWTELAGSKSLIEARLRRPVHLFAYPGGSGVTRDAVRRALLDAGFLGAVTNRASSNVLDSDPFELGRRSAPNEPVAVLAATLVALFDAWRQVRTTVRFVRRPISSLCMSVS
jgi:peptidoglycan/xylan/chitin deacetylase (PgdA/CDA1 family)